jgi:TonB family protein
MAPLTKDSIEVSTSVGETAAAGGASQPKQASGQLRSDAVSLEIPVKVHGSRVTQVVREVTPHTEPFEEQTSTMIVFPLGAVLRMTTAVTVGQMLVVTNAKTRQDAICRVVKVRTFSNAQGYVEIEFSHPQPGYWNVNFASDSGASQKKPASVAPPIQREEPKVEPAAEISWAPARVASPKPQPVPSIPSPSPSAAPPHPARPNAPESSFISIGSQEETQVAASSTARALPTLSSSPRIEPEREARAAEPPKKSAPINFPSAPPSTPVPSLSMAELLGDELAAPDKPAAIADEREATLDEEKVAALIESSAKISQSSFGSLSGGASLPVGQAKPAEPFTSSLDDIVAELAPAPPAPRQSSGFLIAAAILVVFACVVGGGFYFRQQLGFQKSDRAVSLPPSGAPAQSGSITTNSSSLNQPAGTAGSQPVSGSVPKQIVTLPGTTITVSANAAPDNSSSVPTAGQPPASAKSKGPSVTSDMLASTLNAHPTSASRSSANPADGAPSIDDAGAAGANSDAALPDLPSSGNVSAPPPPVVVPEQPLKVGGNVKEPRLITFKQPSYPLVAKEAHIQGDILVSTQIDKAGNVVHMQVISGPTMLRQPALDALRQWKYAPSTLNGQPVSVEMQVTIKFRM